MRRRAFLVGTAAAAGTVALPGAGGCATQAAAAGGPGAGALTVDGRRQPVGVDPDAVSFGWWLMDPARGARQGAYALTVAAADPGATGPRWHSGPVRSADQHDVAYRGPTLPGDAAVTWSVRVAGPDGRLGPESAPARFVTALRRAQWMASWLAPGSDPPAADQYTYLRTTARLPAGTVSRATLFYAAAHRAQLWLNGTLLATGPAFCYPDDQYTAAVDATAAVRPGRLNALGALHHWYGPGQGRPASAPGLLAQLSVRYRDGRHVVVASDGRWRQRRAEWLPAPQRNSDGGDYVEVVDARRHPDGWAGPGFDDRSWAPVRVLGPVGTAPFTGLVVQRTVIAETRLRPVSVRTLAGGAVVADLGRVVAGRPRVTLPHAVAGRRVGLRVGYLLDADGQVSTTHGTQGTDLSGAVIETSGSLTREWFTYLGFRYLQVDGADTALVPADLAVDARHSAMPAAPATFTSSNPTLDRVWSLCSHSAVSCCQEQFVDTPTREKGQFLWDAANESEAVMWAYGDRNLTGQALVDFARSQARYWPDGRLNAVYPNGDGARDYPDFTARYPEWVARYVTTTGDVARAAALGPTLARVADYLWRAVDPATGLVTGLLLSPSEDNNYGYDFDTAVDTTVNVLAANAFTRVAALAALAGDQAGAATNRTRAGAVTAAIGRWLLRPDGRLCDGLRADGSQSPNASQQSSALGLCYGVIPAAAVAAAAAFVASLDMSVEPNHGLELLRGLVNAGRPADALRLLADPAAGGWARILAEGATFTWETWTPQDVLGDSMSHGWGSSALVAIHETFLGVRRPVLAGRPTGASFQVAPPPAGLLAHASGRLPSPAGTVSCAWTRSGGRVRLALTLPPNAEAVVSLPAASPRAVSESGRPVTAAPGVAVRTGGQPGTVTVAVGAGSYHFEST